MSGSVPSRPEEKCLQDNLQVRGNSPFTPSQAVAISPQGSTCESLSISSYSEEPRTEETGSKASVTKRKGQMCHNPFTSPQELRSIYRCIQKKRTGTQEKQQEKARGCKI
ncbi:hypothetical protein Y1Q_0009700 [Alligator mississippiensis]|uniref:Uncharacterized protein n=1 Tax=Alligator mississippiensis TaxID=8496 RepID=A0A151MWG6_ALLMI|nr:hypothetical protein Y1Q_0009700 [Alligator mississippiensis]